MIAGVIGLGCVVEFDRFLSVVGFMMGWLVSCWGVGRCGLLG